MEFYLNKCGTSDGQSFQVFLRESVTEKDEGTVPGQRTYADFEFALCFLR